MQKFVIVIFLCCVSCMNPDISQLRIVDVDPKNVSDVKLTAIAESVTPIALETNDSCLLGKISKVVTADNYFFIVSSDLYQFTIQGRFVRKISRQGHGPAEYLYIQTIAANETKNLLYIATGQKILVYDFDGQLIQTKTYKKFVDYMSVVNNRLWVVSTRMGIPTAGGEYRNIATLYQLDDKLKQEDSIQIKSIGTKSISGTIFPSANYISSFNRHQFIYYPVLLKESIIRDTIYSVLDNQIKAAIKLRFIGAFGEGASNLLVTNIYWSGKYLFANYNFKGGNNCLCIDMGNQEQFNTKDGFDDDFRHTGIANLFPLNKGTMVFVKYGYQLYGIIDKVTESDNPVLMLVKLKE